MRETNAETSRHNLKPRPQRNFLACSASFLIEPRLSYAEMVLPTMHWALFHQRRKATQTCLQDNLMEESPS